MSTARKRLPRPLVAGMSADLGLIVGEALYAPTHAFLPLTGTHIGQIGVCLVIAIIVSELSDLLPKR